MYESERRCGSIVMVFLSSWSFWSFHSLIFDAFLGGWRMEDTILGGVNIISCSITAVEFGLYLREFSFLAECIRACRNWSFLAMKHFCTYLHLSFSSSLTLNWWG